MFFSVYTAVCCINYHDIDEAALVHFCLSKWESCHLILGSHSGIYCNNFCIEVTKKREKSYRRRGIDVGKIYEEGEKYLKTPGYKYAYRIMTPGYITFE